uniref:ZCF125 n=1 Tax=Arundo donax TaxID=35708 RepID=A0A0A9MCU8_ARUDO
MCEAVGPILFLGWSLKAGLRTRWTLGMLSAWLS